MYSKRCEGCGKSFDAQRASRKWCSDNCSRQSRRRAVRPTEHVAIASSPPLYPDKNPDISADDMAAYWRRSLDFAHAVKPDFVMPADLLVELLTGASDQDGDAAEESDWCVVQQALISRVVAGLERVQSVWDDTDGLQTELRMLLDFWGDVFDPHVIAALAASLTQPHHQD